MKNTTKKEKKMSRTIQKAGDVLKGLKNMAMEIYSDIVKNKQPQLVTPLRALNNVKYEDKEGYFKLLGKTKSRTLTASTVKTFAQTLLMMNESKKLVETEDIATKREVYYISKKLGRCQIQRTTRIRYSNG